MEVGDASGGVMQVVGDASGGGGDNSRRRRVTKARESVS